MERKERRGLLMPPPPRLRFELHPTLAVSPYLTALPYIPAAGARPRLHTSLTSRTAGALRCC
uniref:Uncharacterized protein n=1 Tax=Oryza punctata TaxID=4537 RepID=A0A0E0KST7_ORYPU